MLKCQKFIVISERDLVSWFAKLRLTILSDKNLTSQPKVKDDKEILVQSAASKVSWLYVPEKLIKFKNWLLLPVHKSNSV